MPRTGVSTSPGAVGRAAPSPAPLAGVMPGRPDMRYAFSDRADGTMSSMVGTGDAAANRAAMLRRVGLSPEDVAFMRQVHGRAVACAEDHPATGEAPEADGITASTPDRGVAVMVADCVPVLIGLGDTVGAIHAGRGGVELDVVGATVARMAGDSGRPAEEATAVIGPAIGACCYEVPEDMADAVDAQVPGTRATTAWGTPSLDLPAAVATQLRAAGVVLVARAGACTRCHADRWFSHRASTGARSATDPVRLDAEAAATAHPHGRQMGVIVRPTGEAAT